MPPESFDAPPEHGNSAPDSIRDRALLRLGGNQQLLNELVALFLEEAPRQFERLKSADDENRSNEVELISHLLQGQLRMLEQPEAHLMVELESSSKNGDVEVQTRSLNMLKVAWPQILDNVRTLAVDARTCSDVCPT